MADLTPEGYLSRFVRLIESVHPELVPDNQTHPEIGDEKYDGEALLGSIRANSDVNDYVPDALDWREVGFKTGPLNQGGCASCYAFTIATSIQGHIFRRTGKMVPLSVQQIVDCGDESESNG